MRILFFLLAISFSGIVCKAQRNVILIIADDLGLDYCGFYENHLDTVAMPNIRALLSRGVRFKNAWANPLCSPTRAGILTGRYSFRTGVGNAIGGAGSPVLDTAEITIPKLLNKYQPGKIAKANIGKWHLQLPNPVSNYYFPNKMGYDHYEGCFNGSLASYTNWTKITNGVSSVNTNYATTETVNNAVTWIKKEKNKPIFLWLAFNAPHAPFHLPPAGLHSFNNLSGADTDIAANPVPYFKAALQAMDHEIGRFFDSLKQLKKWDSTDIIFIGDNGDDALVSQSKGSAKGSIYQNGICVPFIIAGPSVKNPGRSSDALLNTQDIFATVLELFGYTNWTSAIPGNKPVDSKSILPILKNTSTSIRPWAFTEVFKVPTNAGDGKTMRNTDYKLLHFDIGSEKFFNISTDPTETKNLATTGISGNDLSNYNYLCNEMNTLTGTTNYCSSLHTTSLNINSNTAAYPNPFTNHIQPVNCNNSNEYTLFNSLGEKVFCGKNIERQDFTFLPSGIYFLTIQKVKQYTFAKLIKE